MVEVEEFYDENVEKKNEEFLEGLKQNKKIGDVENEYKKKSKDILKKYEKDYEKKLSREKKKELKKISDKTKPKKRKETPEYKVKGLGMELGWKDRTYIKGAKKAYKIKRKAIDFYQENYPKKTVYFKYKTQKRTKRKYLEISEFLSKKIKLIIKEIKGFIKFLKKFLKNSSQRLKKIIKTFIEKFLKKKKTKGGKEGEGKEKKELTEKEKREQKIKEIENKIANGNNKKESAKE